MYPKFLSRSLYHVHFYTVPPVISYIPCLQLKLPVESKCFIPSYIDSVHVHYVCNHVNSYIQSSKCSHGPHSIDIVWMCLLATQNNSHRNCIATVHITTHLCYCFCIMYVNLQNIFIIHTLFLVIPRIPSSQWQACFAATTIIQPQKFSYELWNIQRHEIKIMMWQSVIIMHHENIRNDGCHSPIFS